MSLPSDKLSALAKRTADKKLKKKDDDKREKIFVRSTLRPLGVVLEPLMNGYLLVAPKKDPNSWHLEVQFETEDYIYINPIDEAVDQGAILLPESKGLPHETRDLLDEIIEYSKIYVDIDDEERFLLSAYVLLSWQFDKFKALPFIRLKGDTGSGKSRALRVFGGLLYKPLCQGGAATAASARRLLDEWRGSWVVDEANWGDTDESAEISKIICARFSDDEFSNWMGIKENRNEGAEVRRLYGPSMIASRSTFRDMALEGRFLNIDMKETSIKELPVNLGLEFECHREQVRQDLLAWRVTKIHEDWTPPELSKEDWGDLWNYEPRVRQIVQPLLQLLGDKNTISNIIKRHQSRVIEERSNSWEGQVVNALYEIINSNPADTPLVTPGEIAEKLGGKASARSVGKALSRVGIRSRKIDKGKRVIDITHPLVKDNYAVAVRRYVVLEKSDEPLEPPVAQTKIIATEGA